MKSLIRNSKQVKQAIDFTGIGDKKMHPTDIDAVFEIDNKILILIEVKRFNNYLKGGQKITLERIADSWHTSKAIILEVKHNFKNPEKDIILRNCITKKIYYKKKWFKVDESIMVTLNKIKTKWNITKLNL
jgi:hypothetical protein